MVRDFEISKWSILGICTAIFVLSYNCQDRNIISKYVCQNTLAFPSPHLFFACGNKSDIKYWIFQAWYYLWQNVVDRYRGNSLALPSGGEHGHWVSWVVDCLPLFYHWSIWVHYFLCNYVLNCQLHGIAWLTWGDGMTDLKRCKPKCPYTILRFCYCYLTTIYLLKERFVNVWSEISVFCKNGNCLKISALHRSQYKTLRYIWCGKELLTSWRGVKWRWWDLPLSVSRFTENVTNNNWRNNRSFPRTA
jgi:hypothetical protein